MSHNKVHSDWLAIQWEGGWLVVWIGCKLVFTFWRFDSWWRYKRGDDGWHENLNCVLGFLKVHGLIVAKSMVEARKFGDGFVVDYDVYKFLWFDGKRFRSFTLWRWFCVINGGWKNLVVVWFGILKVSMEEKRFRELGFCDLC